MKNKLFLAISVAFCPLFFVEPAKPASDSPGNMVSVPNLSGLPEDIDRHFMKGIENIYSLHLDVSAREFDTIIEKYPDQPYGYFGKTMTVWASLEYEHETSSPALKNLFERLTEESLAKSKKWLKKHPKDANAHMCAGGIYGLRAKLLLENHRWLKAYFSGRNAIRHTRKAVKLNPRLYDAYLGIGMYEYYTGTLGAVVRILARLFMHGDAVKGIEYLKTTSEKGHFNAVAAELMLVEIFTQPNSKYSDPAMALELSRSLRKKYPHHPMIHFVEIVSLHENEKWAEVRSEAQEYLKRIENQAPFYRKIYMPRALLALGTSYLAEHQLDLAEEMFHMAAQTLENSPALKDGSASPPVINRWAVWTMVRLANVYDLKGKRELAIKTYRRALSFEDTWGFKSYIRRFLSKPYTLNKVPGQLPPP